jgi:ATP-binding cassette subfamily B protein
MLKKMYNFSDAGCKAICNASIWLGIFNIVCLLPMILIIHAFDGMLEAYISGSSDGPFFLPYVLIGIVLVAVLFFTYRKMYKVKYISASKENAKMRMDIMDSMRTLPESFLSSRDLGDLSSTVMDDIASIEGVLAGQMTEMFGGFISIVVALIAMICINVKMGLMLCVVLPVAAIMMALSDKISGGTHTRNRKKKANISDGFQEYLENIKVLQASGADVDYRHGLRKKMRALIPGLILFEFLAGMSVSISYNVLRVGIGIIAIYGANLLAAGEIGITMYVGFMLMAVWIYEPLSYTIEYLGAVIASKVAATRIKEIRDYPRQKGEKPLDAKNYDIEFRDVSFAYKEEKVLNGVSFKAGQGEITALVGPSGSGKSTITRLVARFWDADEGRITVGNTDISEVDPEELMKSFSIVFQDVTLFNDTIYNNILIGNRSATREEVIKAAADAQCMSFIEKLPEGIDTVIGENGHTLSGGERQRLSIARAFLKDAPIVLLDESTASVDPETETKVQCAIERLTRGRTVLMIAHRLRSVAGCDRIVVLDKGRVVGNGTHEELMKDCALYRKMYELQQSE